MKPLNPIKLVWKKQTKTWGYAIPDKRTIVVDPRLDDKTLLDIIGHETDHILYPFLDEEAVDVSGRIRADVFYRAGFRRITKGDE